MCWIIFDIYIQVHANPHSLSRVHLVSRLHNSAHVCTSNAVPNWCKKILLPVSAILCMRVSLCVVFIWLSNGLVPIQNIVWSIFVNLPCTSIHAHFIAFFRPKRFEDLWGILNRCCMLPQHHWIILRLPSPFCGTANHCTLLHQSKNSLPSHPSLPFPRPMQHCLFQHKSAPVQAVILTFWEFTRVGTVCIRLLEINPRVSDPHSTTGLF